MDKPPIADKKRSINRFDPVKTIKIWTPPQPFKREYQNQDSQLHEKEVQCHKRNN